MICSSEYFYFKKYILFLFYLYINIVSKYFKNSNWQKLEIFKLFISEFEEEEGQKLIRKIFKTIIRDNGKSVFVILERLKGKTLQEISNNFNLSRERVRQIKEKAIRRLKHTSRSRILKTYLG